MKIIVQKFGGTSVTTEEKRNMVIDKVADAIEKGFKPVVVVSAMGRKGDPYATDTLLSLIHHTESKLDSREKDLLMCCGEIISSVVMSEAFARRGYNTRVLTGGNAGIITNDKHGSADVLKVDTKRLLCLLEQDIIPIVTGFQGISEECDFTTLGRGGSDVTGALLGMALKAESVEIYTDVDGIMTADPRIVPNAKILDAISYNEVFQLADQGAKVIHPRAVEYAMKGNVPLVIKNTCSDAPGTMISLNQEGIRNIVTGITSMPDRTQVTISLGEKGRSLDNRVFELLAQKCISIDLINVFPNHKAFTIDSKDRQEAEKVFGQLGLDYKVVHDCCKVAVVGNGMRGVPGVMAKILRTLDENDISVLQTADSHSTIWCLIRQEDNDKAVNKLHNEFFQ